ncbi:MAG: NERD domain-containing protein [Anaerolineae bacterium]|nr:NERD domain-containing protein [Anaerolineae bacterium]
MKLIEPTQKPSDKDFTGKLVGQIKGFFQSGKIDEQAEAAVVARFMRGVDNRFIMLHHLELEARGVRFPTILVGPAGMFVLNISPVQGFFRAKDESWWELNKTTHRFGPGRPNLIKQSREYAQKLGEILEKLGKSHPAITPILIFANPGVHIETSNPGIRMVLMDGVDSLIDSMFNSQEVLNPTEINYLTDALELLADPEKAIPLGEGEDFFGKDLFVEEEKAPLTLPDLPLPAELPLPPVEKKLKFTKAQWTILAVLLGLTIVVLLGAILYALNIF